MIRINYNPEPKVVVNEKRRTIIAETSLAGFLVPEGHPPIRNKFTRNMAYALDGLIRRSDVTVYDEGGTARTANTSTGHLLYGVGSSSSYYHVGIPLFMQYGIGYTDPTIVDNNLASPDIHLPTNYIDLIEETDSNTIIFAGRWSPDANKEYREAGLKWLFIGYDNVATLLARTIFPPALIREAYVDYFEGYAISLPATFTKWFARALFSASRGHARRPARGMTSTAQDGSKYSIQTPHAFAGTPDVMIGSDNTPPSPSDYDLKSPIASLANQAQVVEIDTALQEARIVRYGTYTPTTDVTLGEIGLFANIYGFVGGTLAGRKTLLARFALSETITLVAGTTYNIGIVIKLS